jgi:hypothetical protein
MMRFQHLITSCILALCVSVGLGVAWPSYSSAASVYIFTFTGNPAYNPGWDANGSFSIPVSDFTSATPSNYFGLPDGDGVQLPNTDITAASFTITTPSGGTVVLGLPYINALGNNVFLISVSPPQLEYGQTNYLINSPAGCNPESVYCAGSGIQAAFDGTAVAIFGPDGSADLGGVWTTSVTPLPSTWTMLLIGLVGLGFVGYRNRKNAYTLAAV